MGELVRGFLLRECSVSALHVVATTAGASIDAARIARPPWEESALGPGDVASRPGALAV